MIENIKNQRSYALMNALVFLTILTIMAIALINLTLSGFKYINQSHTSVQAQDIAEGGIYKALYELNQPNSTYTDETDTPLGNGTFTVQVSPDPNNPNYKIITSTGYIPNSASYRMKKTIRVTITTQQSSTRIAFNYGIQIGDLGITANTNNRVNGSVYSNGNINGNNNNLVTGSAFSGGTITGFTVNGTKREHAPTIPLPPFDANYWKTQANINNDPINGDYIVPTGSTNLGPRKITGNLIANTGHTINIQGPVYVQGNITINSNNTINLDPVFGSQGTVILCDGTIVINSNVNINPTAQKGYILLVSTSSGTAMTLNSSTAGAIFFAPNGSISMNSHTHEICITARGLILNSNSEVDYDIGLANYLFITGPGGEWVVKPGSWQKL